MKRVYEPPEPDDGYRVLVDRLWPRGLRKEQARVDEWLRDLAPSDDLRRWYGHDPRKWEEFRRRYREELLSPERRAALDRLVRQARLGPVTLVTATRDLEISNAAVLREVLTEAVGTGE